MSTFKGLFEEEALKHIAADYFAPEVYHCEAFFLSHAHTDHMVGMNATFAKLLDINPEKKLYCSLITKELLQKLDKKTVFFNLDNIIVLDIGKPHLLSIHGDYITVTLIPAGHCPGSVMFLFEIADLAVIFTGDFRYDADDIGKLKLLNAPDGSVKKIDNLYLDTTFAYEEYKHFPSRDQSLQAILTEVKTWLNKDESHIVNLDLPARIGYESVFVALCRIFNMKVHVSDYKINVYNNISDIMSCVTDNPHARLHTCRSNASCLDDSYDSVTGKVRPVLTIRLCTMLFRDSFVEHNGGGIFKNNDSTEMKIFYSTHCSLNELRAFVSHICPKKVTPFVVLAAHATVEILTQRVLGAPEVVSKIREAPKGPEQSPVKKKLKLEFQNEVIRPKLSIDQPLVASCDDKQKINQLLENYVRPRQNAIASVIIDSPPSSPES